MQLLNRNTVCLLALLAGAASSPIVNAADAATKPALAPAAVQAAAAPAWYATKISSATIFNNFSKTGGVLSTSGRSLKFLIDNRNPAARTINFMNGNYTENGTSPDYVKYHYDFAKRRLNIGDSVTSFNNNTYFTQTKKYFAGTIQSYTLGDATTPIYAVQFYPDDVVSEATLMEALTTVQRAFAIPGAKLAFVATGTQQTFKTIVTQARALDIQLLTIDQVLGDIKFIGLNPGEAWGYLRLFPSDPNTLRPTDIAVFDELPLDLSVLSGVITKAYQDVNSHVNLKSKERNTPNMVLRDASVNHPRLQQWADQPVHMVVTTQGFTLESTTPQIIADKLAQKLNRPWTSLPVVNETRLQSFDELCPSLATRAASTACFDAAKRYGGKSTGLAFLARSVGRVATPGSMSAPFGYDLTPSGLGVPVQFYRDMMAMPENTALKYKVDALAAAEKAGYLSPQERDALVAEVQSLFYKAKLPVGLADAVKARLLTTNPGVTKFKFRSSATSEDVANFNGAGLYDSFAIEPEKADNADLSCVVEADSVAGVITKLKVKPKTVQCGLKAVYASLWNSRALVERSFARLDHATAGMGLAINPSYGDEQANLVLVTRVLGSDVYGYSLSVQVGENLVTNPTPGTISEYTIASFSDPGRPARFTPARFAKPTPTDPVRTTHILTQQQMTDIVEVARKIEVAYCKAKPSYYPRGDCNSVWLDKTKPLSLDMEVKILPDGHYQFKQVREFLGR